MSVYPWDYHQQQQQQDTDLSFFDPFEGRKTSANPNAFYQDPFANALPKNGWCRVPKCFAATAATSQQQIIQSKPNYYLQGKKRARRRKPVVLKKKKPLPLCITENNTFESIDYNSLHSVDDSVESSSTTNEWQQQQTTKTSKRNNSSSLRHLPTIAEDTTVFTKIPSLHSIPTDTPLEDYEQMAKDRAATRVQQWLHKTGLVDEWYVDWKALPQNKSTDISVTSKKSQEGVEIGPHGVTLEATTGVAIQRCFQEFSAVTIREMDKLDDDIVELQQSIVDIPAANLPASVQSTVHARTNIGQIFNDVDYFQSMVRTCLRLQSELDQTQQDWHQVKDICEDHVAMQLFLVELTLEWQKRISRYTVEQVEAVLHPKIVAVRELGHSIRSKLLSGVGEAFGEGDLEDLKTLVDSMQLYESQLDELDFTDEEWKVCKSIMVMIGIKKVAVQRILEDADIRAHQVFLAFQEEAADDAGSQTAEKSGFEAVWKGAGTMLDAVEIIRDEMMPVFPPSWNVFPIWAACIGSVCSQYIVQEVGGQEGNNLTSLTPNQLLQFMSFIEDFRERVGHDSTSVMLASNQAEFITVNDLMRGEMIEAADESLIKVLDVLWHIHRLLEDQFIQATQLQTQRWLDSVFNADHAKSQTADGRLITSLPEDVWVLARVQLNTIRERFTAEDSAVFFHAACIIFHCMQSKQRSAWRESLSDVEMCCAAANDALRMIELAEVELEDIKYDSDFSVEQFEELDAMTEQLTTQFLHDAVHSAKSIHSFIFEPIADTLRGRLFEPEWEELTHNDMAVTIVRTLEDYLGDLEKWLEEAMLRKTLDALVKAFINFYIKQLLLKSIRRQKHTFFNPTRALERMLGDICILEDFFETWVAKFPALARVLESEFEILYALLELLEIGVGTSVAARDPTDFFPFIQKKVGRIDATKFLCCQLWHMLSVEGGREMRAMFDDSRDRVVGLGDLPQEKLDPSLQLHRVILEVMEDLRQRLKVKTVAKGVRKSIVKKAGKVKQRATRVIDAIAEA